MRADSAGIEVGIACAGFSVDAEMAYCKKAALFFNFWLPAWCVNCTVNWAKDGQLAPIRFETADRRSKRA